MNRTSPPIEPAAHYGNVDSEMIKSEINIAPTGKPTDVRVAGIAVYFLPVAMRTPLKFGHEILTEVTCCRVRLTVEDRDRRRAVGWGETPLSVQWAWPANSPYEIRLDAMRRFALEIARTWTADDSFGHPLELSIDFQQRSIPSLLAGQNSALGDAPMPYLAALICLSAFDIALHDAYGNLHGLDAYATYNREFMNRDLSEYLTPADDSNVDFHNQYPDDYLVHDVPTRLPVWHLVGGLDPLSADDCTGANQPNDGYPLLLADWIKRDGLRCLKVKLRGNDAAWDYERLVRVAEIAVPLGVEHLSADFNCTVDQPVYVNDLLDRLRDEHADVYAKVLYIEQPFPYELEAHRIDVRSIAKRKPIFLDESAHDWRFVKLGRSLGWTGVCLKTCKTQSGSLLSFCWAKAHGMSIMVQDLTNPMLAIIPHVRLAAHVGTIQGVECNAMQFYPDASLPEAAIHPGIYQRRKGQINLETVRGRGFGYRVDEIERTLPELTAQFGDADS
jgi:L-alanine-DL-glutamate epimerase-like enolase superfamily enzyme